MKKKLPIAPVRAKVRGTCAVHFTSIASVAPGGAASGSGTAITVSSSALPSSGAMKCRVDVRSSGAAPWPSSRIEVTSMRPRSSSRGWARLRDAPRLASRSHVERSSRQAFQYRWNCRSGAGRVVIFRQVMTSEPVIVWLAASSRASIE